MARPVRCIVTRERGTSDEFYKGTYGNKTSYFKNKEIFDEWRAEKEKAKAINDMIADFVGYYNGEKFPSSITGKIKELKDIYDIHTVYDTFVEKKEDIQFAMESMEFDTEYGKCAYIMAIIVNHINDVWKRRKREEKMKVKQEAELKSEDIDYEYIPRPAFKNDRDITRFLED
jgi:hypothetical protein